MKRNPDRRITVEKVVDVNYVVTFWKRNEDGPWVWSACCSPGYARRIDAMHEAKRERKWFCKPRKAMKRRGINA